MLLRSDLSLCSMLILKEKRALAPGNCVSCVVKYEESLFICAYNSIMHLL